MVRDICRQRASRSALVASTLVLDCGNKNKTIGFDPFLRILCIVDNSDTYMQKELFVRSAKTSSVPLKLFVIVLLLFRPFELLMVNL